MNIGLSGHAITLINSGTKVLCHALTICSLIATSQLALGQGVNNEVVIEGLKEGIADVNETDPTKKYLEGLIDRIRNGAVKFDDSNIHPKSGKDYKLFMEGLIEGLEAGIQSFNKKNDSDTNLKHIIEGIESTTANFNHNNPTTIYTLGIIEGLEESRKSIAQGELSKDVLKLGNRPY